MLRKKYCVEAVELMCVEGYSNVRKSVENVSKPCFLTFMRLLLTLKAVKIVKYNACKLKKGQKCILAALKSLLKIISHGDF